MSEPLTQIRRHYPRQVTFEDKSPLTLRLMTAVDAERVFRFACGLPEEDLLYLSADITDPDVMQHWVDGLEDGQTITLIAEAAGEMVGYGSLQHRAATWQRHVGEIQLQVGPSHRGRGLGRTLAHEVFAVARALGLRKILAQMTVDQQAAIRTFEHLGFQAEGHLRELAIDRGGRTHDLVIMTHDPTSPAVPHDWVARMRRVGVRWRPLPERSRH